MEQVSSADWGAVRWVRWLGAGRGVLARAPRGHRHVLLEQAQGFAVPWCSSAAPAAACTGCTCSLVPSPALGRRSSTSGSH